MRERGILFSAPMVRALLAGTKTQTRRVVKARDLAWMDEHQGLREPCNAERCPYGQPGDRLWVRETFQPLFAEGFDHYTTDWQTGKGYAVRYVATDGRIEWIDGDDNITDRCKPGIHMPRWASRITLEVTGVRVERLQDISEADAIAEGIEPAYIDALRRQRWRMYPHTDGVPREDVVTYVGAPHTSKPVESYKSLWLSINGPGSWRANPWVWAVAFRRL